MINHSPPDSKLDPKLRERLLKESKNPFYGPRRILWTILFGSAFFGLLIMSTRIGTDDSFLVNDLLIQLSAVIAFGCLLWFDRKKK